MANMNLNRPGYSGGSDFTGMITDSGSACGDYAGWPKHLARQPLGVPQRDDLARSYYARSSSWATVSEPPASPVLTTPVGSISIAWTSPSVIGQCSTPRGTTKS
jgi:hypothetical protein